MESDGTSGGTKIFDADGNRVPNVTEISWTADMTGVPRLEMKVIIIRPKLTLRHNGNISVEFDDQTEIQ